jgi:hypothetical protein
MKLRTNSPAAQRRSGVTLIECLVYVFVFGILLAGGTAAFFYCWDHTRAVVFTTTEIESALRAGETWRADVRAATGKISVVTTAAGETVTIPENGKEVLYRFDAGEVRREILAQSHTRLLLAKVNASEVKSVPRDGVRAWRWELELTPRRKETHIPLLFTFEAAQVKP